MTNYLIDNNVLRNNQILIHHGIEGQKWGQRNGPPYPLSYEAHSSAEKKANSRAELTGDKKTDKEILKRTYHEGKYTKAASMLAKSESDRALKKSNKKVGFKSEELGDKSKNLATQAKKAEENAKYFTEKFQRQAAEYANKYGDNSFNKMKTDYMDKMSIQKASNFIANNGTLGMAVLGGAIGGPIGGGVLGGAKGYSNYKDYQRYINSL